MKIASALWRNTRRPDLAIEIAETAAELWPALVEKAGLTGRHGRAKGRYDQELIAELRECLFPAEPDGTSFETLLGRRDLSAEALIRAFFKAVAPFSRMKADILGLLTDAGATGSDASLPMMFQFRNDEIFDQFKKAAEIISQHLVDVVAVDFSSELLWQIIKAGDRGVVFGDSSAPPNPPTLAQWLADRRAGRPYRRLPDGLLEGFGPPYAPGIARVIAVIDAMLDAFARHGPDPAALARHRRDEGTDVDAATRMTPHELAIVESDDWSVAAAEWVGRRVADLHATGSGITIDALDIMLGDLRKLLPEDSPVTQRLERRKRLIDFLDLPVWKERNAVYAVWLGTQMHGALKIRGWQFRFHLIDGRLGFPFGGAHLATLIHPRDPRVLLWWTELRTPFAGLLSGHRTTGIQPDYRIRVAPATDPKDASRDVLAVEAKQHLGWKTKEFADALIDYAQVCRNATVLLANYGPIATDGLRDRVAAKLAPADVDRTQVFARMHPGHERTVRDFRHAVARAIGGPRGDLALSGPVTVTLEWHDPVDLDLHVIRRRPGEHVSHLQLAGEHVDLHGDCLIGPARERATIRPCAEAYAIAVHAFHESGALVSGAVAVTIAFHPDDLIDPILIEFAHPTPARWWLVGRIDMTTGTFTRDDVAADGLPQVFSAEEGVGKGELGAETA